MAARLKLEGIDGGVPPDVESAAQSDSTRAPHQARTRGGPTAGRAFAIARAVVHGRSQPVARAVCSIATTSETPAAGAAGRPARAGGRRGDSRSVMPSDALGRTRATLAGPAGAREDARSPRRGRDRGLERPRAPGMSCRRPPPPRAGYVPAPCTHRPSLLPTGRGGERPGSEGPRAPAPGGRRSRNKVSVGEPADGSLARPARRPRGPVGARTPRRRMPRPGRRRRARRSARRGADPPAPRSTDPRTQRAPAPPPRRLPRAARRAAESAPRRSRRAARPEAAGATGGT